MKIVKYIFVIIVAINFHLFSNDEDFRFQKIKSEHGLSQGTILSILQDSKGFMWFGTQDGLHRYDGYSFTIFRNIPFDKSTISNNYISALLEDKNGDIWIATLDGLNKYSYKTSSFTIYRNDTKNPFSISANIITSLVEEKNGDLWIGTQEGGLNKFITSQNKFIRYTKNSSSNAIPSNYIRALYIDKDETLWIGTDNDGFAYLEKGRNHFVSYRMQKNNPNSLTGNKIFKITGDKGGNLLIGVYGAGINIFNPSTKKFDHKYIEKDKIESFKQPITDKNLAIPLRYFITDIIVQEDKFIWYSTISGGIYRQEVNSSRLDNYTNFFSNTGSVNNFGARCLYISKNNIIWIGTNGYGVAYLSLNEKKFVNYSYKVADFDRKLTFSSVRAICEGNGHNIYIGGYSELNLVSKGNPVEKLMPVNNVYVAMTDILEPNKYLIVGCEGSGLFKFNKNTKANSRIIPSNDKKLAVDLLWGIYSLDIDENGTYWVGTTYGLMKIDGKTLEAKFWSNIDKDSSDIAIGRIKAVKKDYDGKIWVGSDISGISVFDSSNNSWTNYKYDPNNKESISNNKINSFFIDSKKQLWIATAGGLNLFDRERKSFSRFTEKDGLPNNVVYCILEDEKGNLWMSTNHGISKFNPEKKTFRNYDERDGLQGNEFNHSAAFKASDGRMYFGGTEGVTAFYPKEIRDNEYIPNIVITDLKIFNKSVRLEGHISEQKQIEIPYNHNVITFEFASLSYTFSNKNQYSYRLEGFSDKWFYLGTKRDITFTNLDPGEYTLHIIGSNNDGKWNNEGVKLIIIVTPPFWKTIWFNALLIIMLILIIVMIYFYRVNALKRANIKLEKIVEIRTKELQESQKELLIANETKDKFFSIIAHDLKNPFNSILGFSEILINEFYDLTEKEKFDFISEMGKASKNAYELLENLLHWSRAQTNKLNFEPNELNLVEILKINVELIKPSVIKKNISINLDFKDLYLIYADKNMLNTVIRNILTNAVKFTPKNGIIGIQVDDLADTVILNINDTGIGMDEKEISRLFRIDVHHSSLGTDNEGGTGIGLVLCKELIEKNNGTIKVKSEKGKGSVFSISIPKKRD